MELKVLWSASEKWSNAHDWMNETVVPLQKERLVKVIVRIIGEEISIE